MSTRIGFPSFCAALNSAWVNGFQSAALAGSEPSMAPARMPATLRRTTPSNPTVLEEPQKHAGVVGSVDVTGGNGWAAPDAIVSRGLSAGGLLQGAVFSMAPRRWRAVVAEVPFVDCVTTMLDPGIPLTVAEWDEWGDPREPAARAYLASYSPYDNVPGVQRPSLLRATASASAGSGSRLLFRPELGAGAHVGPAGRYDHLRYEAEILAFILDEAGGGLGQA